MTHMPLSSVAVSRSGRLKRAALLVLLCACNSMPLPPEPDPDPPVAGTLITIPLTVRFIEVAEDHYRCEYTEIGRVYEGVGFVPTVPPVPYDEETSWPR